jgi:hypothetical protein
LRDTHAAETRQIFPAKFHAQLAAPKPLNPQNR